MRKIHYTIYGLKMVGSHGKKFGWPLETESSPPVIASQKTGASVPPPLGTEFC